MAKFVAIPVGQGDAFYLEREGFTVLVDGGRSRRGFSGQFKVSFLDANGVEYKSTTYNGQSNSADVAERVKRFVYLVECVK